MNAVLLAPSSDASRSKLREDGFHGCQHGGRVPGRSAEGMQASRPGTASSGSMKPRCCRLTTWRKSAGWPRSLNARIVLQGDPRQHKSPPAARQHARGARRYAGLKVAEINKIQRQKGEYAEAVEAIRDGRL